MPSFEPLTLDQLRHLPEYTALSRARQKIVWPLAAATITTYFALILAIAFYPELLGQPIGAGVTSLGVVLGLGVIFFCLLVTGIYVHYANRVLEPLAQAVRAKAGATE